MFTKRPTQSGPNIKSKVAIAKDNTVQCSGAMITAFLCDQSLVIMAPSYVNHNYYYVQCYIVAIRVSVCVG